MEIESRLLPCGLHVVGSPPTAAEAIATLVNIAEIDRLDNDPPVYGLPGILARTIRRNIEEIYLNNNKVATIPLPADIVFPCRSSLGEHLLQMTCRNCSCPWVHTTLLQNSKLESALPCCYRASWRR